jgi:tetratricopeptide (TPR) repeat protein
MDEQGTENTAKKASIRRFVTLWAAILVICTIYCGREFCAQELYQWGFYYKQLGWTEGSRALLSLSEFVGAEGKAGQAARRYLHTKVPRYKQPEDAVRLNIQGYNADNGAHDLDRAQQYFEECIRRYPNFEWPLANVATIYIRRGQLDKAEEAAAKAVSINPEYVNGWLVYATVKSEKGDLKGARQCAERAQQLDPERSDLEAQSKAATASRQRLDKQ